ncbi:hypothetical protein CPAV1605_195 [seawater metagenome]|uniref:Uncharacterized protein n=1 Tax=seawater metagenome TaxID=1561972 RepID=A0A5E8CG99_9ZZZZ
MTCLLKMLECSFNSWKKITKNKIKEISMIDFTDIEMKIEEKEFKRDFIKNKLINIINKEIYLSEFIITNYELNDVRIALEKRLMKYFIIDLFNQAKKEDYELAYIILFFNDLLVKKQTIFQIIQSYHLRPIMNFKEYIIEFKTLFCIISLLIGKYHDDEAMINKDYVYLIKKSIPSKYYLNLNALNKFESNILSITDYHIKDNAEKFIDLYNFCLSN